MRLLLSISLAAAGIIHLLPLAGVMGADTLESLYGLPIDEPNLEILMRHRAVLFGLLGGLLLASVFLPGLQSAAMLAGLVSAASFIGIALDVGGYNAMLSRIVQADAIAVACLVLACGIRSLRKN